MSDQPRDWDRELADIDRLVAKQGAAPAGGTTPAPTTPRGPVPPSPAPVRRRSVAVTWFWVALAVALAAALVIWPYQKACGLQLFFFLGAAGVTVIVGCLGAVNSWAHRRGLAHILSLLVILWAGIVAAREMLPRVGYAKVAQTWTCAAIPATAPAQTPQTAPSSQPTPTPAGQTPPTQTSPTTQPAPTSPAPAKP